MFQMKARRSGYMGKLIYIQYRNTKIVIEFPIEFQFH